MRQLGVVRYALRAERHGADRVIVAGIEARDHISHVGTMLLTPVVASKVKVDQELWKAYWHPTELSTRQRRSVATQPEKIQGNGIHQDKSFRHLFSPIRIGNIDLKNRIIMAPMIDRLAVGGKEVDEADIVR